MTFFSNMKLSGRLFLSVAVMAAAMALIVIAGYYLADGAFHGLNGVYRQANAKTAAGVKLTENYSKDLVSLVNKLALGSYPWEVGMGRLSEIEGSIRSNRAILRQPPLNPDETQMLRDIDAQAAVADTFMGQLRTVLREGNREELRKLQHSLYPSVDTVDFRMELYLNYELGRSKLLAEANQGSFQKSYGGMALLTLVGVLALFLLVSFHLRHAVSRPLRSLVERMRDIAEGEGDLTQRLETTGQDEIGEVARAFNTFTGKLRTVSEMKQELIAVVSHQLKTPVAEINGYIENMLEGLAGELNPKQREYLEEMRGIGWENYQLISDLLSVSKLERGVAKVALKPVSARRIVGLSIRDYEKLIRRKGLDLAIDMAAPDVWVNADEDKTVETLRNIINNAVKCTDRGSISIRWKAEDGKGLIDVMDTGIGMEPGVLERLFTKARVLGQEAHRSGAGLGLFIGKEFMRLQEGDIRVASEPGRGSCFTLVMPRCAEEREGAA